MDAAAGGSYCSISGILFRVLCSNLTSIFRLQVNAAENIHSMSNAITSEHYNFLFQKGAQSYEAGKCENIDECYLF